MSPETVFNVFTYGQNRNVCSFSFKNTASSSRPTNMLKRLATADWICTVCIASKSTPSLMAAKRWSASIVKGISAAIATRHLRPLKVSGGQSHVDLCCNYLRTYKVSNAGHSEGIVVTPAYCGLGGPIVGIAWNYVQPVWSDDRGSGALLRCSCTCTWVWCKFD